MYDQLMSEINAYFQNYLWGHLDNHVKDQLNHRLENHIADKFWRDFRTLSYEIDDEMLDEILAATINYQQSKKIH